MTMNETRINWTELTWNPASGCMKVSPGCKFCYADSLAENKRGTLAFPGGFDLTLRPHKLREPFKAKRPSLIFTSSMTDVFFDQIPDEYRHRIFDTIEQTPQHRYQVLTKRPEIALAFSRERRLPRNVWIGTTIEHQETAYRADVLREIDASVRFVSAEPLIGPLVLDLSGIGWLISGGESGAHLSKPKHREARALVRAGDRSKGERLWEPREDRIPWVRSLRDQCEAAGTAFWHKQWGGPRPDSGGRLLDGREHDGMPTHIEGAMPEGYVHHERNVKLRAKHEEEGRPQLHLDVLP